jgi:hypothetical protein
MLKLAHTAQKNTLRQLFVRHISFNFDILIQFLFSAAKAIDRYIQTRTVEQSSSKEKIDPRLQSTIEGIFNRCIAEGEYKQVTCSFTSI